MSISDEEKIKYILSNGGFKDIDDILDYSKEFEVDLNTIYEMVRAENNMNMDITISDALDHSIE